MPVASRNSRRFGLPESMVISSSSAGSGTFDRTHDAQMGAATAQVMSQRLLDLSFAWPLVVRQERGRFHDHAVDAKAALSGLLRDEGLLYGNQLPGRTQPFE